MSKIKNCPICKSSDISKDLFQPKTMRYCKYCGADFNINGEIISNPLKLIDEETEVKYSKLDELAYVDYGGEHVTLFVKGKINGKIEVWTDRENENREYICLNYEVVYLDTINKL